MSKVLVTGGAGFLGSHIADALSEAGYKVTVMDMKQSQYLREDQHMVIADIRDREEMLKITNGFEYVYHLAALADLNEARSKPYETAEINILGTLSLLEACHQNRVKRFVFGSSIYVYSQHGGFYRCSKQACENYIEEYFHRYGLEYTILRFGSLYGTRTDEHNGVYRLLKQFMDGRPIHYHGSENDKREYIHAEDAARLSVQALSDAYVNKHLTLTGNDRLSIQELFKMFSEILNKSVDVVYEGDEGTLSGHYALTPYTFTPKLGKKLVSNEYVDMGQGLIQVIQDIHNRVDHE